MNAAEMYAEKEGYRHGSLNQSSKIIFHLRTIPQHPLEYISSLTQQIDTILIFAPDITTTFLKSSSDPW